MRRGVPPGAVTHPWLLVFVCAVLGYPGLGHPALGREAEGVGEGIVRLDGTRIEGQLLALEDGAVLVEGQAEPVPLYELSALIFSEPENTETAKTPTWKDGPLVVFRGGERVKGRVLLASAGKASVQLSGPVIEPPIEAIKGFRLREAHAGDDLFESDLESTTPPQKDVVYVRTGGSLLRVAGVFRSLDRDYLTLEYEGKTRRVQRQRVLGVILAPVASLRVDAEIPALVELRGDGRFPAYLRGIRTGDPARILYRFGGTPENSLQAIPLTFVERVSFSSDRVLFLSSLEPEKVEESPLLGATQPFRWKKDLSVTGSPLRLAGKTYRKGLGVHSRSALEFKIAGKYRSFASLIGLDDSAGPRGGVTFRVLADSKEIYRKEIAKGATPEMLVLPVHGVTRLRLEVDFGEDGVDLGDHADWAEARVTK